MSDAILPPHDWADRYARNDSPWDLGAPHPELTARIAAGELRARRAFVGGCGRGHDALALAHAGAHVTAIDIVPALAEGLADRLRALGGEFLVADALAFVPKEPFDLVFEHTFFCALHPTLRPRWGELARRVLAPKGRLWALVFPFDKPLEQGGPPFGTTTDDLAIALGPDFRLLEDAPAPHRAPKRSWLEHWAVFEAR